MKNSDEADERRVGDLWRFWR